MKSLSLEFFKMKRKKNLILLLMFIVVSGALCFYTVTNYVQKDFSVRSVQGWYYFIYSFGSYNGLLMPVFIAVLVSRICDLEHKSGGFKILLLSMSRKKLYCSKYLCCCILIFALVCTQILMITAGGLLLHFPHPVPIGLLIKYGIGTICTSLAVIALQEWMSLAYQNQIIGMAVGITGSFIGLVSLLFPQKISKLFVWSYYMNLMPIQVAFSETSLELASAPVSLGYVAVIVVLIFLFYFLGNFYFSRKEG